MCLERGAAMAKLTVWTAVMSSSAPPCVDQARCPASAATSVWTTSSSVTGRQTAGTPQMKASTTAVRYFRWNTFLSSHPLSINNTSVCFPGSTRIPPCPGSFSCDNRTCVNTSQVCNGVPDCPWGEDELVCGEFPRVRGARRVAWRYESHDKKFISKYSQEGYEQEYIVCLSISTLIQISELEKPQFLDALLF